MKPYLHDLILLLVLACFPILSSAQWILGLQHPPVNFPLDRPILINGQLLAPGNYQVIAMSNNQIWDVMIFPGNQFIDPNLPGGGLNPSTAAARISLQKLAPTGFNPPPSTEQLVFTFTRDEQTQGINLDFTDNQARWLIPIEELRCPPVSSAFGRISNANVSMRYNTISRGTARAFGGLVPRHHIWIASGCFPAHFSTDKYLALGNEVLLPGQYTVVIQTGDFNWRIRFLKDPYPFNPNVHNPPVNLSTQVLEVSATPQPIDFHPDYWGQGQRLTEENLRYSFEPASIAQGPGMNMFWDSLWLFVPMEEVICVMRINTNIANFAQVNRDLDESFWKQASGALTYISPATNNGYEIRVIPERGIFKESYQVRIGTEISPNIRQKVIEYFSSEAMRHRVINIFDDAQNPHEILVGLD